MVRRSLCAITCALVATVLAVAFQPVLRAGAQSGGGCELQGTASFNQPLTNTAQPFNYSFSGALSPCQSTIAGSPASGQVGAGNVVPEQVTVSTAGGPVQATFNYQEPLSSGNGSCASNTTSGTGLVVWADGTQTALNYSTTGAAAAVALQASVLPSVVLQPVPGQGVTVGGVFYAAPAYTFTTTRYTSADSADAALAFQPPDPTLCASSGVTTAGISGAVAIGQP